MTLGIWQGTTTREILDVFHGRNHVQQEMSGGERGLSRALLHGFDSFRGLPEDWAGRAGMLRGFFDLGGQPPLSLRSMTTTPPPQDTAERQRGEVQSSSSISDGLELHVGWFNETLAPFARRVQAEGLRVAFVHFDANLYSSTKQALDALLPVLAPDAVLLFDDFLLHQGWEVGEAQAWAETVEETPGLSFEWVAYNTHSVLVQLTKNPTGYAGQKWAEEERQQHEDL